MNSRFMSSRNCLIAYAGTMPFTGSRYAATLRLDGRPRLVVWLFLGFFAIKTCARGTQAAHQAKNPAYFESETY